MCCHAPKRHLLKRVLLRNLTSVKQCEWRLLLDVNSASLRSPVGSVRQTQQKISMARAGCAKTHQVMPGKLVYLTGEL